MIKDGRVWKYESEPTVEWKYFTTVTAEVLNCQFEPQTSETACSNSSVITVIGEVAYSRIGGHRVLNPFTCIWDYNIQNEKGPIRAVTQVFSGTGDLINTTVFEPHGSAFLLRIKTLITRLILFWEGTYHSVTRPRGPSGSNKMALL